MVFREHFQFHNTLETLKNIFWMNIFIKYNLDFYRFLILELKASGDLSLYFCRNWKLWTIFEINKTITRNGWMSELLSNVRPNKRQ